MAGEHIVPLFRGKPSPQLLGALQEREVESALEAETLVKNFVSLYSLRLEIGTFKIIMIWYWYFLNNMIPQYNILTILPATQESYFVEWVSFGNFANR